MVSIYDTMSVVFDFVSFIVLTAGVLAAVLLLIIGNGEK